MSKATNALLAFALGAVAGATAGLLLAPATGEETRKNLKKKMDGLKDDLGDLKNEMASKAEELKKSFVNGDPVKSK